MRSPARKRIYYVSPRFSGSADFAKEALKSPPKGSESLLDIAGLSKRLGIPRNTLYDWVAFGRIPYLKLGKLIRFEPRAIEDWIALHRAPSRENPSRGT